jgi:outer membrane protein OmpA-like peptidoglycan-associated protein
MTLKMRYVTMAFLLTGTTLYSQEVGIRPEWWFGGGLGLNYNMYSSDIKKLNGSAPLLPLSFTKGSGAGLQLGLLVEYRPTATWGGSLGLGFDSRSGSFDDIQSGGTHTLATSLSYLTLEPNLRFTPFESGLYLFAGPRLGFNLSKSFEYTGPGISRSEDWSDVRGVNIGGQIGAGYDIPLTSPDAEWQIVLAPRASLHFGQGVRSVEEWSVTTLRLGVDVKFATTTVSRYKAETAVEFSVRSPFIIPKERRVEETFPMRNSMFFDEGSAAIPARYVQLTPQEAGRFAEDHLLEPRRDLVGRSARQLLVYYNILNVIGDRMRRLPQTTITVSGSSDRGIEDGRAMAENVKRYLVSTFGIAERRIGTLGRTKPEIPSHQPGGTRDVEFVKAEDRRVDVMSESLEILLPVRIISLQEDPLDADIVMTVPNASHTLASWSVEVVDANGKVRQFGPFTQDQERIPGNTLLGERSEGEFRIRLMAQPKSGGTVMKEERVRLARAEGPEEQTGLRYSIVFEFDQSKTVATYDKFLRETVVPSIPEGASVIIHGHTDIVGEESYNLKLSRDRATETMNIIQRELNRLGRRGVRFDTFGFGEDPRRSPFENRLPEERFYNRTVVIDIVPQ